MLSKLYLKKASRLKYISNRKFTEAARMKNLRGLRVHNEKYFELCDKTGIIVTLTDQTGILSKALAIFDKHEINLTHIESKPSKFIKKRNAFDFYLDFEGRFDDERVRSAISDLKKLAIYITV